MVTKVLETLSPMAEILRTKDFTEPNKALNIALDALGITSYSLGIKDFPELCNFLPHGLREKFLKLPSKTIKELDKILKSRYQSYSFLHIKNLQRTVQVLLSQTSRKKLAAFFTTEIGLKIMKECVRTYLESTNREIIVADPFMGAALTLTEPLQDFVDKIKYVWGIEIHPLLALVGYAALVFVFRDVSKISVFAADAFDTLANTFFLLKNRFMLDTDIVLTNPPFTRWETLDENYRKKLLKIMKSLGYNEYIRRGQTSLHVLGLFLIDRILKKNSLLVSVLPASTFYTIYGEGYKKLLRERYAILSLVESLNNAAFSDDSGFKELILIAKKEEERRPSVFLSVDNKKLVGIRRIIKELFKGTVGSDTNVNVVDLYNVFPIWDRNWLVFFGQNKLRDLLDGILREGMQKNKVKIWKSILPKESIVRGVEMYGPDFFLIPNKYWRIIKEKNDSIVIENAQTHEILEINRCFLVKTLRRPALYRNKLIPDTQHYFLAVPPIELREIDNDLRKYIEWGKTAGETEVAERAFGKYWYSHVYIQIKRKKPFGRVFLPDKIDLTFNNRGVFANYSPEPLTATKNFYIIRVEDSIAKLLTAWFNSIIFISLFLIASRRISETWTRFLEDDYLNMPILNPTKVNAPSYQEIEKIIHDVSSQTLPHLKKQLKETYRYHLDEIILNIILEKDPGNIIRELYGEVSKVLK
ncbi:MAG: N-6 DNA methylase [Candidatus Njordarchaeales archaeon]